jgi:hypothetical protein
MSDVLWQSFGNVVRAGIEADALLEAVEAALGITDFPPFEIGIEDWHDETLEDELEWVTTYVLWSYRIYERKPRRASRGMLALAVSFYRNEDMARGGWNGARQAKFYVGMAPSAKAWTAETLVLDGAGASSVAKPISSWRWCTAAEPSLAAPWFFCVRLAALQSRQDIVREIITPFVHLLRGVEDAVAFQDCEATLTTPLA